MNVTIQDEPARVKECGAEERTATSSTPRNPWQRIDATTIELQPCKLRSGSGSANKIRRSKSGGSHRQATSIELGVFYKRY